MMRGLLFGALVSALLFVGVELACTPATAVHAIPAGTKAACILLHALAEDGTVDSVCATAEELAPFVGPLLLARSEEPEGDSARSTLAFAVAELPTPLRAPPRRRCVTVSGWGRQIDSGVKDAAARNSEAGGGDSAAGR